MNILGRAIAREFLLSSPCSSSRKCLLLMLRQQQLRRQHPVAILQQHPSLYSTTADTKTCTPSLSKNQEERYTAKNPKPPKQPEIVHKQTQEPQRVIRMEQGLKKKDQLPNADLPRPSEIPWQSKVANSVNLIGHVQIPVQFEASPDGKYWAGTIVSRSDGNSFNTPPFWIPIIFEGDLAHIAACHLKAKDHVHISGQLSADPPPFTMAEGQANVQVMVRSISFVKGSFQTKKVVTPQNLQWDNNVSVSGIKDDGDPAFQSWRDLVRNPLEWWDNREDKLKGSIKPNYPDFKHKDSGLGLWLNRAPKWLWSQLEGLQESAAQLPKVKLGKGSELKQEFAAQLPKVKLGKGSELTQEFAAQLPKVEQGKSSEVKQEFAAQLPKVEQGKSSEVKQEFDAQLPKVEQGKSSEVKQEFAAQLPKVKRGKYSKGDDSWTNLVENPDKWWDNRTNKINKRSPDFKHKVTGEALWLSGSPAWVLSRLPPLKADHTATFTEKYTPLSKAM